MTSISLICCMERNNLSQPMPYQGAPQRGELAEVDVDWLIAERPGKGKNPRKQHPRKKQNGHQHRIRESQHPGQVEHPFRIIKRQFGFVKARYKVAEKR